MSLSLASASSQYLRNNNPTTMPGPTNYAFGCWFRTTTAANQTLMWAHKQSLLGTMQFHRKLTLYVLGATVGALYEIKDYTGGTGTATAVTSSGIDISANGWNFAAGSDDGSNVYVWLKRHDGVVYTGSAAHSVTPQFPTPRHAIGSEYAGANYMNGQIAHAMSWNTLITRSDFDHIAEGKAPPMSVGGLGAPLEYWFPLINAEYWAWFGSLDGARLGQTYVFDPQNSPTVSSSNPNVFPMAGMVQVA